jgi:hypothetical protein
VGGDLSNERVLSKGVLLLLGASTLIENKATRDNEGHDLYQRFKIVEQQIDLNNFYNIHSPRPKYVLAFLYAKTGQGEKVLQIFESLKMYHFKSNTELRLIPPPALPILRSPLSPEPVAIRSPAGFEIPKAPPKC